MILLGVVINTGCQGNSLLTGTPVQIISSPTTQLPIASERLTVNPTQTPSPSITVVPIPTYNPVNVQQTPNMNEVPISTPFDPSVENIVTKAKEDLAQRLMIDPRQIDLVEVASVTWSDGSLGCPQPEMMYTQVLTPGYRILLDANRVIYEYHSSREVYVIYCENPDIPFLPSKP